MDSSSHRAMTPGARMTIGVLIPSVGGFYFGGLIEGITRAAARAGHRVVAVQTFPTRLERERHLAAPLPGGPWCLDAVDGVVVVMDAVPPPKLVSLHERGLPIVMVAADLPEFPVTVVLPDNAGGANAAVEHLLGHGHSRIGFAGDLTQRDIRERFEAYRDALAARGIEAEDAWFFAANGNQEQGGLDAGARFLAAGRPTTATLAGTDINAIGFMRALRASDRALAREHAVIGFDHTEIGARFLPRLSTVNPHHDDVGVLAVDRLIAEIEGDESTARTYRVPSTLVIRESCGCSKVSTIGADPGEDATRGFIRTRGRARVQELSSTAFAGPVSALSARYTNDETRDGWTRAVLDPLVIAAESGSAPSAVALRRLNTLTVALQPHPEALELLIAAVREVELELSAEIPAGSVRLATLQRVATDVLIAISRSCTKPLLARNGVLERTIGDQYEVDMDLLAESGGSPRGLAWLPANTQSLACLGIWVGHETASGEREIEIVGARGRSGSLAHLVGERMPVSQFPPEALTRSNSAIKTGLTFVIPVTTASRDWGLLAINGRVESHKTISRERYHHWAAMLAVALDQEEFVDRLRKTERELTQAASAEHAISEKTSADGERLSLWTQALEYGTWDWDVSGGTVYYSPQWKRALGHTDAEIGSSSAEWLDRVHPDDRPLVSSLIAAQLGGDRTPLRFEHRVRTASGGYRRMLCSAITVLDEAGCPSRIVGALIDVTDCGNASVREPVGPDPS